MPLKGQNAPKTLNRPGPLLGCQVRRTASLANAVAGRILNFMGISHQCKHDSAKTRDKRAAASYATGVEIGHEKSHPFQV